jgi:hypothetical protein
VSVEEPIANVVDFPLPAAGITGAQLEAELIAVGIDAGVWVTEDGALAVGSAEALDADRIAAVIDAHVPAQPVVQESNEDRVAVIVDASPDWQSAMKSLAAEGLMA